MCWNAGAGGKGGCSTPAAGSYPMRRWKMPLYSAASASGVRTGRGGGWNVFPGYVFLQSARPDMLLEELDQYREVFHILAEPGYMIPVYEEEEASLRELCGARHVLPVSYGYRDREAGRDCITRGPLKGREKRLLRLDWHRKFAQVEVSLARRKAVIWAGIGLDEEALSV